MNARREAFLKDEIAAQRRRAEAAEAELVDLRRQVLDLKMENAGVLMRAGEAEAELAGLAWRPGSETPDESGYYETCSAVGSRGWILDHQHFDADDADEWRAWEPDFWRAIPDVPTTEDRNE